MEFDQIKELIKLLQGTTVGEFKYETTEMSLSIRTKDYQKVRTEVVSPAPMMPTMGAMPIAAPAAPVVAPQQEAPQAQEKSQDAGELKDNVNYLEIKSPMVGTFYRSSSPEKPPFVKVGDVIGPDDTVCLIEAMKLFNEVKSEVTGRVVKVLAEDASPVEYEQVLFLVEPLV
ncbi:acetyl-CoA carboxylase biotin carboxyl carrier protein [Saprospira sp. CCB-QB6]|uniref:acetyl-CoA carboxylase biotin carboxyl carrier protein n=1 Tax=Saprospira sp. CCB-QB6 TaxID=3023936 RepID=UPI00234AB16A|nr:acetyl-CoA carboxylase biotin carboxyl carrier protein [Saprospira sp. CCB-QB6]WCL80326.1 acetyl-CoA carboxylase biotin carboxyl carrier protein [Saprospira sp. CCB-QB6]